MIDLEYHQVASVKEAVAFLGQAKRPATIVAGATNIMVDIRQRKLTQGVLLDIGNIGELRGITASAAGIIRIGALTTIEEIAVSALLRREAPALAMAANVFADPLIRKRASLGGNLANASPAADMAPPLLALDARVVLQSLNGQRTVPLSEFFLAPNKTQCGAKELLIAVEFAPCAQSGFVKIGLRNAMAISVATAAAALVCDQHGNITNLRISLGAVAPTPLRALLVEEALLRQDRRIADIAALDSADFEQELRQTISPISDIRASAAYRQQISPVVVKRALTSACCEERGYSHDV